jgi:hypothetical protein
MAARVSKDGEVEIEFYVVRTNEGHVSVWYEEPPFNINIESTGPFIATAQIPPRLAPH